MVTRGYKKLPDLQVINRLNPAPNIYRADKELPRDRQLFIPPTLEKINYHEPKLSLHEE